MQLREGSYSASDLVGKMGIESAAESILRGVKGNLPGG